MNDAEFRLLDEIEEGHWWFVGKRLILRRLLERINTGRMLDLGCGTGGVLRDWKGNGESVGIDRSSLALQICARRGFKTLARGDLTRLPFRDRSFDTVLMLDVIEHLEDDVGFVRNAARICREGGLVVIAVPAFPSLWSQHDETFEHYRRYRRASLRAVALEAGLEPERFTYTNSFLFPVAAAWRFVSYRLGVGRVAPKHDFWPIPRWLNGLLVQLYRVEAWLLGHLNLPAGVSVICLARVPRKQKTVQG